MVDWAEWSDYVVIAILISYKYEIAKLLICWLFSYCLLLAFEYIFEYLEYVLASHPGLPSFD